MRKSKVKVDIDNCLNNLVPEMFKLYEERTEIKLKYEDCVNYDFSGIASQDVIDDLYGMFTEKALWDRLRPPDNAQEYLKKLYNEFDVRLVTATDHMNFAWKVDWMAQFYPFVPSEHIYRVHDKSWISADYAIDDYQENLKNDMAHRILINAPWNLNTNCYAFEFHRAKDMKSAYETICGIETEEDSWR